MMNQGMKFDYLAIFNLQKRIHGLDHDLGAHKVHKCRSKVLHFFTNILRPAWQTKQLKFDSVAMFEVLKIATGSDLVSMVHINIKGKTDWVLILWEPATLHINSSTGNNFSRIPWDLKGINGWNLNWLLTVLTLLKTINGSDLDLGAHELQKLKSNGSCFITNILRSVENQWLKTYVVSMFELLKISNGLDQHLGPYN